MAYNSDRRRRVRNAFLLLTPSLIGVVLFLVIPVIFVMVLSLTQWKLLTPIKWVGFSNYANIFRFDGFGHSLLVTAYYVLLNIPVQTVLALALAMLLNRTRQSMGALSAPVRAALPGHAGGHGRGVELVVQRAERHDQPAAVADRGIARAGLAGQHEATAMPVMAFANIWQYAGYNMLFFLAGLQAIPLQPV